MPFILESEVRLEQCKKQLEDLFGKKVVPHLNALLQDKGFRVIRYLYGVLDEARSDKIVSLFEEAAKNKDNSCLTSDAFGEDVVTMGGG